MKPERCEMKNQRNDAGMAMLTTLLILSMTAVLGLIMLVITFAVVIAVNRIPGFGDARLRNT